MLKNLEILTSVDVAFRKIQSVLTRFGLPDTEDGMESLKSLLMLAWTVSEAETSCCFGYNVRLHRCYQVRAEVNI